MSQATFVGAASVITTVALLELIDFLYALIRQVRAAGKDVIIRFNLLMPVSISTTSLFDQLALIRSSNRHDSITIPLEENVKIKL